MLERKVYNEGKLIVGCISGVIDAQTFFNSTFWQIDSINIGKLKPDYSQIYFDKEIVRVEITASDVTKFAQINAGMATHLSRKRTALVIRDKRLIPFAELHQLLSQKHHYQVKIFNHISPAFSWLGFTNPNSSFIK